MKVNPMLRNINNLSFDENGIPYLTVDNVNAVCKYIETNTHYSSIATDGFAKKYFSEHKGDTSLSTIITKIILIDAIDSTNLKQLLGGGYYIILADRIKKAGIEPLIASGSNIGEKFREVAEFEKGKNFRKL